MFILWKRCLIFMGCVFHLHSIQADDIKTCKNSSAVPVPWQDGFGCAGSYQKIQIITSLSFFNPVDKAKSPGVDPKQLAAELQKVSLQQSPLVTSSGVEKGSHVHSGTASATSSAVPSPGQPGSPSVSKKRHSSKVRNYQVMEQEHFDDRKKLPVYLPQCSKKSQHILANSFLG